MSRNAFDGDNEATEYDRWRQRRWQEVAGPGGKASLIAYRSIAVAGQEIPEVPGRWTATGHSGNLTLTATRTEGVSVDGQIVDGTVELTPTDRLSFPGGRHGTIEELAGGHALAVWDPAAPTRATLRGITVWPWDPAWIVAAMYFRFDDGRIDRIEEYFDVVPLDAATPSSDAH